MKWLFGFLLLAFLAFFAYMQWGGQGAGQGMQPQPPLNAEKIRLLPVVVSAPVAAQPVASACMEWGEISDGERQRAAAALSALKLGNKFTQRQVEHVSGYWVYLPPPKNVAEVEQKVAEIKEFGLAEYFVVQDEGKWHNAISLGVFKTVEAAHKFRDSVKAKGLQAAKAGERMSKRLFTVFVLKDPDAAVTAKMAALQKDFPGSEIKAAACAEVFSNTEMSLNAGR